MVRNWCTVLCQSVQGICAVLRYNWCTLRLACDAIDAGPTATHHAGRCESEVVLLRRLLPAYTREVVRLTPVAVLVPSGEQKSMINSSNPVRTRA